MEEDLVLAGWLREALELGDPDLRTYSPLALAYIGDAVYELFVRTRVVCHGSVQVQKMHAHSLGLVNAAAQAKMARLLRDEFTEEEADIFRRGRNARSYTMAKHATTADYRTATALEALFGYLYLNHRFERLLVLMHSGLEKMGEFAPCETKNGRSGRSAT